MSESRHKTFSSSNIWKLTTLDRSGKSFGAPALKYIKQVQHEINLDREINKEVNAMATSWGKLCEKYVFNILPTSYSLVSQKRLFHKFFKYWSGAPDLKKESENTSGDIKSPFSLEVFCDKVEALKKGVEAYKEEFPEDYWQHISNTILLNYYGYNFTHAEAIIFCPYKTELESIKELAGMVDDPTEQRQFYRISQALDEELPWILEGGKYQNLNIFKFEIPKADQDFLTDKVSMAGKRLVWPSA